MIYQKGGVRRRPIKGDSVELVLGETRASRKGGRRFGGKTNLSVLAERREVRSNGTREKHIFRLAINKGKPQLREERGPGDSKELGGKKGGTHMGYLDGVSEEHLHQRNVTGKTDYGPAGNNWLLNGKKQKTKNWGARVLW